MRTHGRSTLMQRGLQRPARQSPKRLTVAFNVLLIGYHQVPEGLQGGYASAKQNFQPHKTKNYCGYRSWNYH
jgi:hypothetical protein